jgi:hypothetical protein
MGLGKRFSYKLDKKDETTPGPGMYSNISPDSIQNTVSKSLRSRSGASNPNLDFGVSKK